MIWIILLIVIAVILISFISSLNKDTNELQNQNLEEKFKVIIDILNKKLLNDNGKIQILDRRSFNLYYKNKILQFVYGTGNLNITYRQNLLGEEVVCERLFENLRNTTIGRQTTIAEEYVVYVEKKTYALNTLKKVNDFKVEKNTEEITKFKLSSIFYDFCFSIETVKVFLHENPMREYIVRGLEINTSENGNILKTIFKTFIKKKYNLTLEEIDENEHRYDNFTFNLFFQSIVIDEDNYLEIISNDFYNVKNEYDEETLIACDFIVFCKHHEPKAIFVVVYDPTVGLYAIRRIYESGVSVKLTFIDYEHELADIDYIVNYIKTAEI